MSGLSYDDDNDCTISSHYQRIKKGDAFVVSLVNNEVNVRVAAEISVSSTKRTPYTKRFQFWRH